MLRVWGQGSPVGLVTVLPRAAKTATETRELKPKSHSRQLTQGHSNMALATEISTVRLIAVAVTAITNMIAVRASNHNDRAGNKNDNSSCKQKVQKYLHNRGRCIF